MKFSPGQTVTGHLYFNNNRSNIEYEVKILDILSQGDHFNYYKAVSSNGGHVCVKAIRYRSEKKSAFHSAIDYIKYRRKMLLAEHRILATSHPCLPEPLAMITLENGCQEDQKLFAKFPEWQELKREELVLVQEYFAGYSLTQLQDQIQLFSIKQRLKIVHKLIKLLGYLHDQGFIVQSLRPEHIIVNPEHNDNLNIIGLHYSCPLKSSGTTGKFQRAYILSGQDPLVKYRPDVRIDIRQLGIILYYLITLKDPLAEQSFNIDAQQMKKAVQQLSSSHSWVLKLLDLLLAESIHKRLHSIDSVKHVLSNPPQEEIEFEIVHASRTKLEVKITKSPSWGKHIELRIEDNEKGTATTRKMDFGNTIAISGKWRGEITCGLRVFSGTQSTWWKYKSALATAKFPMSDIPDLPTDQVGFEWPSVPNLKSVSFFIENAGGKVTKIGEAENSIILPTENYPLPHYQKIKVICQPNFLHQDQNPIQIFQEIYLVPTVDAPVVYNKLNQIFFEIALTPKQRAAFSQVELLHNQTLYRTKAKEDFVAQIHSDKIVFKLNKRNLSIFEKHLFSCRILLDSIGWKKGPTWQVDIAPPGIQSLSIDEVKLDTLLLSWQSYPSPYLYKYDVVCDGKKVATTSETSYEFQIPKAKIISDSGKTFPISIMTYYEHNGVTKKSQPSTKEYRLPDVENILRCRIKRSISPKSVVFELQFKHFHVVQEFFYIYLYRKETNSEQQKLVSKEILRENTVFRDEEVTPGKTYNYLVRVEGVDYDVLNETQEIPQMGITCSLEQVEYETCSWLIHIDQQTLNCMGDRIEIHRKGKQEKVHEITWDKSKTRLQFKDRCLMPGEQFEYYLYLPLEQGGLHEYFLGNVSTKKFELEVDAQASYNSSDISWKPSPHNKIDCIQIYNQDGGLLARTKSPSITLQNLEPERDYTFPLKYRYLSGYIQEGVSINFTTQPYKMETEITDFMTDSFRLKWDITDGVFASKIKQFLLKVSSNVGEHELHSAARSVQLKQLLPCTTYQWAIHGLLKSGNTCLLSSGEATTETPELKVNIEVGLIHHITWEYEQTPAISKIEVHRNDLPLIETDENELYDSDFKGGKEITYRFFYVMSDGRKLLATEEKVQSLSMKNLFSAVKIQPKTGAILWDFTELKKYNFFSSVELFFNNNSIYHEENNRDALIFEDWGQSLHLDRETGLPEKSMNFELAVIGIAPIERKCKKKWTLSIKGIKCYYSNLPYQFQIFREYSSIYFQWEKMPTDLLQEVSLERLSDNRVMYSGSNEAVYMVDDNDSYGLENQGNYQYIVKLKYKNHQTLKKINVSLDSFDEDRLNIQEQVSKNMLSVSWLSNIDTSITHIGWCKSLQSFVPKFLKRYHFVDFSAGEINIPIQPQDMGYELVYKDCYNNIFYGIRRNMPKGFKK